jgi:16S rRNA (uracil1498-N3)-methyltransferase
VAPRFFVPGLDPADRVVPLPADEAAHLRRVLRLRPGAIVQVFDGHGHEWRAEVTQATSDRAAVRLVEPLEPARESSVVITLVVTVLKGDKMNAIVRDAVMLGVAAIRPVVAARSEGGLVNPGRQTRLERWRRTAVASAKQCGRAVVPPVHPWQTFESYLESSEADAGARLMLVEPAADVAATRLRDVPRPNRAALLVGPEGGWTRDEIAKSVDAGATPVRLGGRTLRADAVPLIALASCQVLWDEEVEP